LVLTVYTGKLEIAAPRALRFGSFDAGNVIRGHFGKELFRSRPSLYRRLYDPLPLADGPSGFADPPRPFVLRTRQLAGRSFESGEPVPFGIHVFDASLPAELGDAGFTRVDLELSAGAPPASSLEIRFLTPTEIRGLETPEFGAVFARLRDRLSLLRAFYGAGPLEIDFRGMGERARAVRLVSSELETERFGRRSTSQGTRQALGGFYGCARYEGELTEFLPFLHAGAYAGVGKYTVWGQGEISTALLPIPVPAAETNSL
jgi:hypothetical protein